MRRTRLRLARLPTNAWQVFALSTKATPEQIGRIGAMTINVAPFFQRSSVIHVSPKEVTLLDSGKHASTVT